MGRGSVGVESARLAQDLEDLTESAQDADTSASELEALHAELDARKTLIKSLRSDLDRLSSLEDKLEEKRGVIAKLEESVDRHAMTIEDLHATIDRLKSKGGRRSGKRSREPVDVTLPPLSSTDVQRALEEPEVDHTIAIDMRESLIEARRSATKTRCPTFASRHS